MPDFYNSLLSLEKQLRNLRLQHQQTLKCQRTYLAHRVSGHVKWYNVKQGYGFITRDDTSADVFVHKRSITMNNIDKLHPSVGDGEAVEFDVVLVPGRSPEAVNVTGPNGTRVQGSMYSPDRQFPYPTTVVHAAMKVYCENIRAEPSLLDDTDYSEHHLENQPSSAMVNEAPEPGTSICPEEPFVEPSPDDTTTKPAFDYMSYGYLYDSDDCDLADSTSSVYSAGSLHESDFTTPYDSEDESVNSDCETQTESAPVTLEPSTSTHNLYISDTGSQESDTDILLNEINSELAADCEDQEIESIPDTCTFEQSTSTEDLYMYSQYFPTEEECDDLAYACRCLESFHASCCPHLRNKICTFLLLCHLEKIQCRCPSLRMVYVLKAYANYLFDEADLHCHLFPYVDIFKRVLFKYWNLREYCQEYYVEPEIAPLRTVSPSDYVQRLLQENLIDPEIATSVNASQMLREFSTTHRTSCDPDDYGHVLDQLVLMFYCSQEQEQMLCTLYNWYRRWQLCYSRAVGKESRLMFL